LITRDVTHPIIRVDDTHVFAQSRKACSTATLGEDLRVVDLVKILAKEEFQAILIGKATEPFEWNHIFRYIFHSVLHEEGVFVSVYRPKGAVSWRVLGKANRICRISKLLLTKP